MKVSYFFAWYYIWIGFFWDDRACWLYFLPIPMFGVVLKFLPKGYEVEKVFGGYSALYHNVLIRWKPTMKEAYEAAWAHNDQKTDI